MAFVRRKGNKFYLVHNVRRGEKVMQIHLARLGERAQITERVVREVSKKHPFVELNWRALRDQVNGQVDLADSDSPVVQKLVGELRDLNLELADLFPPGSCCCSCGSCSPRSRSSCRSLTTDADDLVLRQRTREA